MRRFFPLFLLAGIGAAVWYYLTKVRTTNPAIQQHFADQQTNQVAASLAAMANELIRPPVATTSSRGPLDGLVWTVWDNLRTKGTPDASAPDTTRDVTFRPTDTTSDIPAYDDSLN